MDLIKIGKYIAFKRKEQVLTQKQLAEKLNMSDKSVSKWERGICLPDVSVYLELCKILDISINEFLAGEDIPKETIEQKAEENIIQITKDNKNNIFNNPLLKYMCCFHIYYKHIYLQKINTTTKLYRTLFRKKHRNANGKYAF